MHGPRPTFKRRERRSIHKIQNHVASRLLRMIFHCVGLRSVERFHSPDISLFEVLSVPSVFFLSVRLLVRSLLKMSGQNPLMRLEQRAAEADQIIEYLKQQVQLLKEKASKTHT